MPIKKVVSASFSTFHMFDQAAQLHRLGLLQTFFCGPPARFAARYGIAESSIRSLVFPFALGYLRARLPLTAPIGSQLNRLSHDLFSSQLARLLPDDLDIFVGLSAFSEHALKKANSYGATTVVDHGSLHEKFERQQLLMESDAFGFKPQGNSTQKWLIDKEDREFQQADHVTVLSKIAKKTLVANGVDDRKIWVNPPGVSLQLFSPHVKEDDVFRVVFCGQVNPRKGLHYLLMALKKLRAKQIVLWVIGSTGELEKDLHFKKKLEEFDGLDIHYFGSVKKDQLARLFSQCSVFVLPSLADGFGMVVTQAMATGLPVIVSDQTGAADFVEHGNNGFIVPTRDVDQLATHILELYQNQSLAAEMGQEALAGVASGLTWNDYGDRLATKLLECVDAK